MKAKTETENGFRETEIGLMPSDWDVGKLEDVADTFDKQRVPLSENERQKMKGDYPYCGANGVIDHINDYIFDGEYVLLSEDGGYWSKFDDSAYIMNGKFWVNNHAHILKAIENKAINKFLMYVLNYLDISIHISGTTRGKLTQGVMRNILLPLPSLPEQQKIASVLSKIQQVIKQQDKIIQTTKELKKSMMNKLFTEGLHGEAQKETEIGMIPKSWKIVKFGEAAVLKNGINFSVNQKGNRGIPTIDVFNMYSEGIFVNTSNLYRVDIDLSDKPDYLLRNNDILFVRSSLKKEGVGWTNIFKIAHEPITFCGFIIRARLKHEDYDPLFLTYFFRSEVARRKLVSSERVAITNINQGMLQSFSVPMPQKEEQQEIVNVLSNIDIKIQQTESRKQTLQSLFKTMLNRLMTGRVRVKDLNIGVN